MAALNQRKLFAGWADYGSKRPFVERFLKQIHHTLWMGCQLLLQLKRPPVLLVWPEMPSKRTALHKMARRLGWEITNHPRNQKIGGIRFADSTEKGQQFNPPPIMRLETWLNHHCSDIRKQTLENAHYQAFGYGMSVDPLVHQGPMVVKSDLNAQHDGKIINGPIGQDAINNDSVYQINIDNRTEDGRFFDYRVVWIHGEIPVIYQKFKRPSERFTNETYEVLLLNDQGCFSETEIDSIARLNRIMGIDYAELDVLRDAGSEKIYVVDINPTPWGPPTGLNHDDSDAAIERMAESLQRAFLESNK